jgi:PAS domain S-box-containing protein
MTSLILYNLKEFLKHVRFWYVLFTSLIIIAFMYGLFEIIEDVFLSSIPFERLRWLFFIRGLVTALLVIIWALWTVYKYRGMYRQRLEEVEERYRSIIENSADAIISLDNQNSITTWNNGAEKIFGWKEKEMVGTSVAALLPQDFLDKHELDYLTERVRKDGYVQNYETECLTKTGKRIHVQLTEALINNEAGEPAGKALIMRDVTEQRLNEEKLQQSERLATVGHLAAGVAHEIGNPLTAISSLVQLLQRKTEDAFVLESLTKVRDQINRIHKIERDLVDFSRPSSAEMKQAQINDIIQSAIGLMKHDTRFRSIEVILDLERELPRVMCVPDQVHQVIANLLLNAADAVKDCEHPRIALRTTSRGDTIQIKVEDNGHGIPKELQQKIFEPFFTTKPVGKGTGLGLSVSHGIITKIGGNIRVESAAGEGAKFIIELPQEDFQPVKRNEE